MPSIMGRMARQMRGEHIYKFIDFIKALNAVSHNTLIDKLMKYRLDKCDTEVDRKQAEQLD